MTVVGAGIGQVVFTPDWLNGAILSRSTARIAIDEDKAAPSFVQAFLESPIGKQQILDCQKEGAQPVVSCLDLAKFFVAYPPLPEQRAIAGALSDVGALLGALDRLIAKKHDLKQAAMQQLLTGQTRLPGFHGEWEVKRLGDVGACLRGVSYQGDSDLSSHDTTNTKRLLRSNNVQNATIVTTDIQFVNALRVSVNQLLRENDILICMANGSKALVGKAGLFRVNDSYEYTFGAFMGCFRTNSVEANPSFVFYLFQIGRYRDCISNLLAGSSINNLRPSSIESLEFPMPPLPEQTAIAEVLSGMDAELAALEQRRDKTRALKQGMMQELLTGRIRLL
jgi:type I restriction enzyme S subunit